MTPADAADEDLIEPAEVLEELLEEIAEGLGLDVDVEVEESGDVLIGRLEGDEVGLFIGRHGQTIDAVQHLAQRIVFPDGPSDVRVTIDADGYRERREQLLRADANDAAEEVLRSGHPVELDPLPPAERRVIHEHLRDRDGISTHSEGDDPDRFIVVSASD
jgi:spoIIIJ-associated protein